MEDPVEIPHQPKYSDTKEASKIYFLPNSLTAGNLFFGFLAIIWCIRAKYMGDDIASDMVIRYYTEAVWFILIACLCDSLDGRLARLGGRESLFGKEFDSIADMVSFGVAPAFMVIFLILSPLEEYPIFRELGLLIGFIYLLCAGVRLARFNVITSPLLPPHEQLKNSTYFLGLPVPAAAGTIASLVLVLNEYDLQKLNMFLPMLMLLIAGLMVSNIPYPSFKEIDWHTQIKLRSFIALFVLAAFIFFFKSISIVLLFLFYIFFGLTRHVMSSYKRKKKHKNDVYEVKESSQ